jgi:hypothetical protein
LQEVAECGYASYAHKNMATHALCDEPAVLTSNVKGATAAVGGKEGQTGRCSNVHRNGQVCQSVGCVNARHVDRASRQPEAGCQPKLACTQKQRLRLSCATCSADDRTQVVYARAAVCGSATTPKSGTHSWKGILICSSQAAAEPGWKQHDTVGVWETGQSASRGRHVCQLGGVWETGQSASRGGVWETGQSASRGRHVCQLWPCEGCSMHISAAVAD